MPSRTYLAVRLTVAMWRLYMSQETLRFGRTERFGEVWMVWSRVGFAYRSKLMYSVQLSEGISSLS